MKKLLLISLCLFSTLAMAKKVSPKEAENFDGQFQLTHESQASFCQRNVTSIYQTEGNIVNFNGIIFKNINMGKFNNQNGNGKIKVTLTKSVMPDKTIFFNLLSKTKYRGFHAKSVSVYINLRGNKLQYGTIINKFLVKNCEYKKID